MRKHRRAIGACLLVGLACAVWWPLGGWVNVLVMRELFRFGELVGITPTGAGARLAGQVLGFNYHEPPTWYGWVARSLAAACALAPVLLPALWARLRWTTRRRVIPTGSRVVWVRGMLAALVAGVVFHALNIWLEWRVWEWMIGAGEWLGGTVYRISGVMGVGEGGPFMGGKRVDAIANMLVRYGPGSCFALAAGCAAGALHAAMWRRDARRAAAGMWCARCGYDLSGTGVGVVCPECGGRGNRK